MESERGLTFSSKPLARRPTPGCTLSGCATAVLVVVYLVGWLLGVDVYGVGWDDDDQAGVIYSNSSTGGG